MELLLLLSLLAILLLFTLVFFQQKKIEKLTKPKYGFLGKKLNLFILVLLGVSLLSGGFFTLIRSPNQTGDLSVSEVKNSNNNFLKINYQTLENNKIQFIAVPFINNIPWNGIDKIDIYWEISPETGMSRKILQSGATPENNQGITISIQKGKYKVKAIFNDGKLDLFGEIEILFSE